MVRLYRTFSTYIVTGETRSAGCLCNRSERFKLIEPHRTYSNHNSTEIARCGEGCHWSSGWFDSTEPSLSTSLQGKQGVQGAYALSSGWFKHIEPLHYRDSKMWRVLTHEFGVVRPYRNVSINSVKGETRCAGCLCTSSGWFKHIEPHRTYTNHTITEIARCVEVSQNSSGGSTVPNLLYLRVRNVKNLYARIKSPTSVSQQPLA